jgi:hypothetical protein
MQPIAIAFWIFFGAIMLWVLIGFVRVFSDWNDSRFRPASGGRRRRRETEGAHGESGSVTSAFDSAPDRSSGDSSVSGSGETSNAAPEFSGGGGEYGGAGATGGWSDSSSDSGGSDSGGDSGGSDSGGGDSGGGGWSD